jgi:hypothetical protein
MNNKKTTTLYPVSKQGEENDLLSYLIASVQAGNDPVMAWADFLDVPDETIAELLECPLNVYRLHIKTRKTSPVSPLEARHILNFCENVGIHPADMAAKTDQHEDACHSNIFSALLYVQKNGKYKADRLKAGKAVDLERVRYNDFLESQPHIAEMFTRMQAHACARGHSQKDTPDLTSDTLRACFTEGAVDIDHPQFDIDDYHLHIIPSMKQTKDEIYQIMRAERQRKIDLSMSAEFLFGRQNKPLVLDAINNICQLLDSETQYKEPRRARMLSERLRARFPLNQKNINALSKYEMYVGPVSAVGCVAKFAEAAVNFKSFQSVEDKAKLATLEQRVKINTDFVKWVEISASPEFLYMQRLYNNNAIDIDRPQVSVSVAAEAATRYDHT